MTCPDVETNELSGSAKVFQGFLSCLLYLYISKQHSALTLSSYSNGSVPPTYAQLCYLLVKTSCRESPNLQEFSFQTPLDTIAKM